MALTAQQNKFINDIIPYILKYAPQYNILCPGIVLVQACKESGYGTSYKAGFNNYFGLKYRPNRCPSSNGTFVDGGSEQNPDGSYRPITDQWFKFPNMEAGVKGYFDFTNITNYKELKNEKDGLTYLKKLQKAKYFTSQTYVETAYKLYRELEMDTYDKKYQENLTKNSTVLDKTTSGYTNSPLVNYTKLSPHCAVRKSKISKITIHHMAGNLSVETCANVFNGTRQASSNYGIGTDGRIGLYVEEKNRAFTSSNAANDDIAVTIEVANNSGAPDWTVSDKAFESLINLCVDICKRNGIKQLTWTGDKNGTLTCHYMFKATACPGPYLKSRMAEIANLVNQKLEGKNVTVTAKKDKTPVINAVKNLQEELNKYGNFGLKIDGIMGPLTIAAYNNFKNGN